MFAQLLEIVKKHPTREKILLQSSGASGNLLVDRICREQGGVINFRVMTTNSLAINFASLEMARHGVSILPVGGGDLIVQNILPAKGYYHHDETMPGLPGAIWQSLAELRLAEISPDQIRALKLEPAEKSIALSELLEKTMAALQNAKFVDWAGVFAMAIKNAPNMARQQLLIVPANLSMTGLEKKFVDSLKCEKIILDFHAGDDLLIPETWLDKRAKPLHVVSDPKATPAKLKKQVSAFISPYFDAEILEVIRRIKATKAAFEDIEIAIASPAAHAAMVFSLLDTCQIDWAAAFARPITDFRIGRAADSLSRWLAGDFLAADLLAMLEANEIRLFPQQKGQNLKEEIPGILKVATLIRDSHAIGGRDGYEKPLEELRKIREEREREIDEKQIAELQARLKELFDFIPEHASPGDFARGFSKLFKKVALPGGNEEHILQDQNLIKRIMTLCDSLANLKEPVLPRAAAMQWLNNLIVSLKASDNRSHAGRVLITSPGNHGLSGRQYIYFVGLNHSALPGNASVDPVLNEELRSQLKIQAGADLTAGEILRAERLAGFSVTLASLRKDAVVCMSASEYELDKRAASLTPEFVKLVKRLAGDSSAKFSDLRGEKTILPVCSYESLDPQKALDLSDLLRIHGLPVTASKDYILSAISPTYARYEQTQSQRASLTASVVQGLPDWDPVKYDFRKNGKAVSTSYINSLTGCTFYHFLKEVLHCMPGDQLTWQETVQNRWLNHLDRGSLLHEIFEIFMRRVGWPVKDSHKPELDQIVEEVIEKYRAIIPPPDLALFMQEKKRIIEDAAYFFELEKKQADSDYRPIGYEVNFGMYGSHGNNQNNREPVKISFPDGSALHLRGKIDRIDQGPNGLRIVDYKTGQSKSYREDPSREDSAILQLAIYTQAAEELSRRRVISGNVAEACLYFPTVRGEGHRIDFAVVNMADVITKEDQLSLFDVFSEGKFQPMFSDECQYCNACEICPFRPLLESAGVTSSETDSETAESDEVE